MKIYKEEKELILKILLFILCPFLSFLYSLRKLNSKSSYIVFFLFGILFAWVIDTHEDVIDFGRIALRFYENQNHEGISSVIEQFINGKGELKEIYEFLLDRWVYGFSSNYHSLFVVASIPFLYAMLSSLKYITGVSFRTKHILFIAVLLFVLPNSIFFIQNFRYPTAVWICVYCLIKIFYERKRKFFYLLLTTPLIHAAFYIPVALVFLFHFMPSNFKFIKYLYYISIPFAFITLSQLTEVNLSFLPEFLQSFLDSYTSNEAMDLWGMNSRKERSNTGIGLMFVSFRMIVYIYSAYLVLKNIKIEDTNLRRFFLFYLFFFSVVNLSQPIPVLGGRLFMILRILTIFFLVKCLINTKYNFIFYLLLVSCSIEICIDNYHHYTAVLPGSFFYKDLFSLIYMNLDVSSYYIHYL